MVAERYALGFTVAAWAICIRLWTHGQAGEALAFAGVCFAGSMVILGVHTWLTRER